MDGMMNASGTVGWYCTQPRGKKEKLETYAHIAEQSSGLSWFGYFFHFSKFFLGGGEGDEEVHMPQCRKHKVP